jgi:anaerobic selenocysteine-containing dehydrogenase
MPLGDELRLTNMRVNHLWNNLFDFVRRPYTLQRWPANFLQINPADAATRGIENGDLVQIENDAVLNQVGERVRGSFTAIAYLTSEVTEGTTCAYFHYPKSPANSVVPAFTKPQPINQGYNSSRAGGG